MSLRKVNAQSGFDQSRTPFSQQKPVFSIRFLLVGVPYHSEYLNGVADIVEEDLEDEELWEAKDLKFPTEDGISISLANLGAYKLIFCLGSDIRELKSSITRSLCLFIGLRPQISQRLPLMPSTLVRVVSAVLGL
jgi:fatty acid synthase subunit alpha, fungi type